MLFIAIDDLNDWATGLSEYRHAKTPHIDALAARGTLFSNAHCAAPACNPSRASVMTGVSPSTSGVYYNWQDWRENPYLKDIATLPEHFRDHGYKVLGGGKLYHAANLSQWGLAGYLDAEPWHEYFPSKTRQLADEYVPGGAARNGSNRFYRGRLDWDAIAGGDAAMGDAQVVQWAERQLAANHGKPLFLGVGIYRPHIPWYTPEKWFQEYPLDDIRLPTVREDDLSDVPDAGQAMSRRPWQQWMRESGKWKEAVQAYLASVSFADAMVGRLIKALDEGPHADNTVIVLWSDHGYHLGHKEHWEKFVLWEQATHVPLIFVDPKSNSRGGRCSNPTSLLDVYPTLAELCGTSPPRHLEGQSLVSLINDPTASSERAVVTTQGFQNHAVRSNHYRYIRYADGSEELYDHRVDENVFENVADRAELENVKTRLKEHLPAANAIAFPPRRSE